MGSIGQAIKHLRHQKGLSQQKIQELSQGQVKAAWIASLETDRLELLSSKQIEKLKRIAEILDVSVLDIYREAGLIELPHPQDASPEERQILDDFRQLSPELKQAACSIVRDLRRATRREPSSPGLSRPESSAGELASPAPRSLEVVVQHQPTQEEKVPNESLG